MRQVAGDCSDAVAVLAAVQGNVATVFHGCGHWCAGGQMVIDRARERERPVIRRTQQRCLFAQGLVFCEK